MKCMAGNGKHCLKLKLVNVLTLNRVLSQWKALTFQSRDVAASGGLPHHGTCPLSKGFWLDGFSGS
jgi:hypothetical protein